MKKPRGSTFLVLNFVLFQAGWWLCVLGGSVWALVASAVITAFHLTLTDNPRLDLRMATLLLAMGVLHDNLLAVTGLLIFSSTLAPVWILCLWWLLGLTLRHSLSYFYRRPGLAAIGGALGAVLAYGAGVTLSSAAWGASALLALAIIGTLWLLVLPLHYALARRWRWV